MLSGIVVVQDYLNDFVVGKDEGVGVRAVDDGVGAVVAGGESGVERGYFGADVGDAVDEGVVGAVAEVVHHPGRLLVVLWVE